MRSLRNVCRERSDSSLKLTRKCKYCKPSLRYALQHLGPGLTITGNAGTLAQTLDSKYSDESGQPNEASVGRQ